MPCHRCGRIQTDPVKGASPWARGVIDGEQVLVCPECQRTDPDWTDRLDRCPSCGSSRLSVVLGSIVCRACGHDRPV
jgi:hypothetical protein